MPSRGIVKLRVPARCPEGPMVLREVVRLQVW